MMPPATAFLATTVMTWPTTFVFTLLPIYSSQLMEDVRLGIGLKEFVKSAL